CAKEGQYTSGWSPGGYW
nr:immunoglobulin heavy chain junction region [Macaca mulatta]MOW76348.1 immunoglobulin heavy chain junction region [Macaca mulatta]MOW78048.1 immunoglobulin heavy chain junction region [Macaca mulatta]MOW80596.1 immunoglobulin heavy chain junction region [Macaca mulatta]